MSWRSLDLLRQNLGDVGEGVTSYIKNRQEEAEREQQHQQMKDFLGSEEGKGFTPSMASLAFSGANYRAFPALAAMANYRKAVAPKTEIIGSARSGYRPVTTPPFGGAPQVGEQILGPAPEEGGAAGIAVGGGTVNSLGEAQAALSQLVQNGVTEDNPTYQALQRFIDASMKHALDVARAQAGIQTGKEISREERQAEAQRQTDTNEAVELGKQFGPLDTQIGYLKWRLGLRKIVGADGKPVIVGPDGNPAGTEKDYILPSQRDAFVNELKSLQDKKKKLEQDLIKAKTKAAGKTRAIGENYQVTPGGVKYKLLPDSDGLA